MNCQLASTNVFLGGQLQWDLVVSSTTNAMFIRDFHLSPISEYLDFQYNQDSDLLNYKHLENVKRLYGRLKGDFFKNSYNPKLDTLYPTHFNDFEYQYENTYHCGVKRMPYKRYGTQFHAFCPVWIEDWDETKDINIYLNLYTLVKQKELDVDVETKKTISSKKLCLTNSPDSKYKYHDKFSSYFKEYLNLLQLDDNVCSIDFLKKEAWIRGVNVERGILETRDTSYVIDNILDRERPLLEFNSMLNNQFRSNKICARQLFNFNICFNVYDVVAPVLLNTLLENGSAIHLEVTAEVVDHDSKSPNKSILEFKDFFTNHEHIERLQLSEYQTDEKINCLDYLQDNKCIDFIDKNKISPQICHWSLLDESDYVFQLYDGFAPVYYEGGKIVKTSHKYYNMPDIWSNKVTKYNNSFGWCNVIWNDVENIFTQVDDFVMGFGDQVDKVDVEGDQEANNDDTEKHTQQAQWDAILPRFTKFWCDVDGKKPFVFYNNSLKYVIDDEQLFEVRRTPTYIYSCIIVAKQELIPGAKLSEEKTNDPFNYTRLNDDVVFYIEEKQGSGYNEVYIWFVVNGDGEISDTMNNLNYKNFINCDFSKLTNNDPQQFSRLKYLPVLQNYLRCVEKPKIVFFNKSIDSVPTNHPDPPSTNHNIEIEYRKNDSKNQYLIRYDGKIRPCMISINNTLYKNYLYCKLTDDENILNIFNRYIQTKFKPLYPSVNYFAIDKIASINYNEPNILPYLTGVDQDKKESIVEYNWYNSSKVFSLWQKLKLDIVLYENSIEDVIIGDDTDYYENYQQTHSQKSRTANLDKIHTSELEQAIKNKIEEQYSIPRMNEKQSPLVDYIYSQYDVKYKFEYISDTNINGYTYKVTLELK